MAEVPNTCTDVDGMRVRLRLRESLLLEDEVLRDINCSTERSRWPLCPIRIRDGLQEERSRTEVDNLSPVGTLIIVSTLCDVCRAPGRLQ